jgi:ATP-dependent DNA helicase UvrD/PcrA
MPILLSSGLGPAVSINSTEGSPFRYSGGMNLLDGLNEEQRWAVEAGDGPTLIAAGPGTGKTKTLTARIAWLLEGRKASASEIVALTFTNKTAREMRERVGHLLDAGSKLPKITTFHALGADLLKSHGFTEKLLDERQRTEIIREISKPAVFKGVPVRELSLLISRAKTSLGTGPKMPSSPARSGIQSNTSGREAATLSTGFRLPRLESRTGSGRNDEYGKSVAELLRRYESALGERGLHDFDDLLAKSFELLRSAEAKRTNYKYLLVDEFQDTSELQYELLKLLGAGENIFAIGDPNQSIYAFRGAGAEMFERFRADFPNVQGIDLTVNYRSRPEIVKLANAVFPKAPQLEASNTGKGVVQVLQTLNEYSEAAYILSEIERGIGGSDMLKANGGQDVREPRDYAVLYRTHRAAKVLQRAFAEAGVPYQIAGEGSPYEQPEIQAVIAIMRYLHRPAEEGKQELMKSPALKNPSLSQLEALLVKFPMPEAFSVCDFAARIVEALPFDKDKLQQNLQQFLGSLVQFGACESGLGPCLEYIDKISESEFYDPSVNAATLLTIHAAKGLEFNHVFLAAAEEETLPKLTKGGESNLEEERRLFYVAVTRAKENLEILHAKSRGGEPGKLSRFVSEIPESILLRTIDPSMTILERRTTKRRQKRAQTSLF